MPSPISHRDCWRQRRLLLLPLLLLLLLLIARLPQSVSAAGGGGGGGGPSERKPLSAYTDADLERLYKQWEESDPDDEPENRAWKSPQLDLTKAPDLSDPTLILQHSSRGQPVLLSVKVAAELDRARLETLSHTWQLEMFNAHMETTRRVHEDGRVLLVALDGSQVVRVREYLLAQPLCHSVTIEGHTMLGRGAAKAPADSGAPAGKTEL